MCQRTEKCNPTNVYWAFNLCRVLCCLDRKMSKLQVPPSKNSQSVCERYVFISTHTYTHTAWYQLECVKGFHRHKASAERREKKKFVLTEDIRNNFIGKWALQIRSKTNRVSIAKKTWLSHGRTIGNWGIDFRLNNHFDFSYYKVSVLIIKL